MKFMSNHGKWTFSQNEEIYNEGEYFDTKEETIAEGKEYFEGESFFVGQVIDQGLGVVVYVDDILEDISENMYEKCGEVSESYLTNVKDEHKKELEIQLGNVISNWIKCHGYEPTFFQVDNIEGIEGEEQ